ncbi:hypothetical protein KY330_00770 [Candidatus Woesearchaeota archaeon]|nr:hypothetical protein [Candidatus Woesearchaeota archaeon]
MSLIDDKNNKRLFLIADNDYIKDNPNFGIQEVNSDWKPLDFFELYTNLFIAELNPRFTEYSYGCKIIIGDQYDKEKQTEIHFASGSSSSVFHMDDFNVRFNAAVLTGDIYKLMGRIKTPKGILHGNKRKEGIIRFYSQQIRNSGETFRFWRKSNDSYGVEVIKEKTIAYGTVECEYHEQMPSCIGAIYPLSWKNEWGNPRTPKLIKQLIQTLEDPTNTNPNFTTQKN